MHGISRKLAIQTTVLYIVKQRLCDQFVQNWQGRLEQSSRARVYKNISSFKLQPYLYTLNVSKYHYAMSKLIMSSHRLHIETCRWSKPKTTPLNERTCINCNVIYNFISSNIVRFTIQIRTKNERWKKINNHTCIVPSNLSTKKKLRTK